MFATEFQFMCGTCYLVSPKPCSTAALPHHVSLFFGMVEKYAYVQTQNGREETVKAPWSEYKKGLSFQLPEFKGSKFCCYWGCDVSNRGHRCIILQPLPDLGIQGRKGSSVGVSFFRSCDCPP